MPSVLRTLRDFARGDFHAGCYAGVAAFLALALAANQITGFHREVLTPALAGPWGVPCFFAFYALPYYAAAVLWALAHRDRRLLRSRAFWGVSTFALLGLALDTASGALPRLAVEALEVPAPLREWVGRVLWNADRTVVIALPVLLFRFTVDRERGGRYGFTWRGFSWRRYALLFAVMLPLVAWASTWPSFLDTYPRYRPGAAEAYLEAPHAATFAAFEASRALRFVTLELFFRGFLLLGLARWLGPAALLPMVSLYTFWHFGKPWPEAAGSAVAAWTLGALALSSRSIAGGVALHAGVALAMELFAYAQLYGLSGLAPGGRAG